MNCGVIFVELGRIGFTFIKERQIQIETAFFTVVHTTDKPVFAGTTSDGSKFSDFSVKDSGVIPNGRNVIKELQFRDILTNGMVSTGTTDILRGRKRTVIPVDIL